MNDELCPCENCAEAHLYDEPGRVDYDDEPEMPFEEMTKRQQIAVLRLENAALRVDLAARDAALCALMADLTTKLGNLEGSCARGWTTCLDRHREVSGAVAEVLTSAGRRLAAGPTR